MAIQMDDSDSITVSEQSEPSAECWQNMYKLLNFYSLISDPTGILEKSSPENCLSGGNRHPTVRQSSSFLCFSFHFYIPYLLSTHYLHKFFLYFLLFPHCFLTLRLHPFFLFSFILSSLCLHLKCISLRFLLMCQFCSSYS